MIFRLVDSCSLEWVTGKVELILDLRHRDEWELSVDPREEVTVWGTGI